MSDSKVDLPLPDGPIKLTFCPGSIVRSTSSNTCATRSADS